MAQPTNFAEHVRAHTVSGREPYDPNFVLSFLSAAMASQILQLSDEATPRKMNVL
jgi:hypothetical protein